MTLCLLTLFLMSNGFPQLYIMMIMIFLYYIIFKTYLQPELVYISCSLNTATGMCVHDEEEDTPAPHIHLPRVCILCVTAS